MGKIWKKDYELDELVERFTVGEDYLLDRRLVAADCLAGMAHARMLSSIGVLTKEEASALERELAAIIKDHDAGRFIVERSDEDCHTAIENRLTARIGESGKKIHTGRSRNDQVIAALRIYTRAVLLDLADAIVDLVSEIGDFAELHREVPMPGRTHMQPAMPSSVGLWAASFAEELLDDGELLWSAYLLNDQSPLGSAASYGVPLPLDREKVAELLGFHRVQNNVLYVNNSRGKFESVILDAVDQCCLTLAKLSQDLILFSMPEFRYFSLPAEMCSGSSIMPQKKNPDVLELIRSRSAAVSACSFQIKSTIRSLPSGYNRDFQDTKEPFLRALDLASGCVGVMNLTVRRLEVNRERLTEAFSPEIFATDAAYDLVRGGKSFRDAYREIGLNLDRLPPGDPERAIGERTSAGAPGNLRIDRITRAVKERRSSISAERVRVEKAETALAGFKVPVV